MFLAMVKTNEPKVSLASHRITPNMERTLQKWWKTSLPRKFIRVLGILLRLLQTGIHITQSRNGKISRRVDAGIKI